ncbi:MAG: THUMP domain-containing protein [Bacteroidota bacterium]
MEITVKTLAGLEEILANELKALGATEVQQGLRMVSCQGDMRLLYAANLHLGVGIRVLQVIDRFIAHDEKSLYRMLGKTDWSQHLDKEGTLWVDAISQSRRFKNTQFLARLTKDAIVDQFRTATGTRPSVVKEHPDLRINVHIGNKGHTTLSLDSSGEGLHRRGYRRKTGGAPLNEVLAAGLLRLAEYQGEQVFVDPMCGSGTILCEAALIAAQQAPGLHRTFGFSHWPNFDAALWEGLRAEAKRAIRPLPHPIIGLDQDPTNIPIARVALSRLQLEKQVDLQNGRIQDYTPPAADESKSPGGIVVTNPPYELRLRTGNIEQLYQEIGDAFKKHYKGYSAWLFSANRDALKRVGLRTSRKIPLMNGPLEARLQRYDMY